jgi:uncharacterized membrane protein
MQSLISAESERGLRRMIIATIVLWIAVGCLIFVCGIFQFRPYYWQTLTWGAVIVIGGSAGPQLLPKWRGYKALKWVRAVCVGVVIATGTLVSTYGWNERSSHLRDRALLIAATTEWRMNGHTLDLIGRIADEIREDNYRLVGCFPTLFVNDIRSAVSQVHLLSSDTVLASNLAIYAVQIDKFNSELRTLDAALVAAGHDNDYYKMWVEQTFGDGKKYSAIQTQQRHVGAVMRECCPWAIDEAEKRLDSSRWRISVQRP